ncbi:MAG: nucleoside 2-deoxyribosyltransferase [Deltaproteobacteria bacterium]|jgi:nucleoside 2-deoxyribosyltransferase|nr:nucleoside 2-deoxyribosyltransferase [Deltaproteobacteria bacterium]
MKIYFAGPDVFRHDYLDVVAEIRCLCSSRGLTALVPGNDGLTDPQAIYEKNVFMIREADGVIANLDPFRSPVEPDSGTVFEMGFARALGKWVIARISDARSYRAKLEGNPRCPCGDGALCLHGAAVEDFGLPLNLMAFFSADSLAGSLAEAVDMAAALSVSKTVGFSRAPGVRAPKDEKAAKRAAGR